MGSGQEPGEAEWVEILANHADRRQYRAGETVCRQGAQANRLYVIVDGRATAVLTTADGLELTLETLGPGALFGESAAGSSGGSHAASVIASNPLTTLELARERFHELRTADPQLAVTLSALVADRARVWSDLAVEALTLPAEARVLRRLLMFAEPTAAPSGPTTVTITQQELASAAGVARATVNRVLGREALSGTLSLGRGKVTLLDTEAIVRRVGKPSVPLTAEEARPAPRARPAPVREERRTVTVLVAGVGAPTAGGDDADLGRRIIGMLERRTGATVGQVGRKIVASFAAGGAGTDALGAVAAAAELLHPSYSDTGSGVGVATGEVVVRSDGIGDSVTRSDVAETALSLQASATPGQVLLDDQTRELTHRHAKTLRVAPGRWELVGPPTEAADETEQQILVGRDDELRHVLGIFDRVIRDRRPRLVTLSGPAGIGKTRLAHEVAALVNDLGARTLWGRSRLGATNTGYSAVADQLKSLAGIADTDDRPIAAEKLARAIAAEDGGSNPRLMDHLTLLMGLAPPSFTTDRSSLFRAARQLFEMLGATTPLLLVFDDVQWVEPTVLDLIEWLAVHVSDTPMLLLALARPELADNRPGWGGGRPGSSWLELDGLPPDDATTLLSLLSPSASIETRRQIVDLSGGNPLFLEELAAAVPLGDPGSSRTPVPLPVTVTTAISGRLDTLPQGARAVLLDAAVIGASFWPGALVALGHRPALEQALEALEERKFVRRERRSRLTGEVEYRFRHDLIQVVAYGRMPAPARRQRHAAVAGWLERAATADTGESASTIAYHLTQAGEFSRAHRKLARAAAAAGQAGAHREAATLLGEILDGPGAVTDVTERAQLLAQRGVAHARVGEWNSARADLEAALGALPPDAVDAQVKARVELAMVCQWLLDLPALRQNAQDALQLARNAGREDLAAAAEGAIGWADSSEGRTEASLARFEAAMAHSEELPTDMTGPMVELSALTLYWLSRPVAAIDRAKEALALGLRGNDSTTVIRSLGNLILAQGAAGQYEAALATYDQAKEFGNEYGTATFLARATAMCGGVHLDLFDYEGAEALAEEARERAGTLGFALPQVSAAIDLLLNYARRGEPSKAHGLLRSTTAAVRAAQGAHGWLWRLRLAQAHAELNLARGEWEAALRATSEVTRRATAAGRTKYQVLALCVAAQARHQIGDHQASHDAAAAAEKLARPTGEPALILRSLLVANCVQPSRSRGQKATLLAARMSRAIPDRSLRGRFAAGIALPAFGNGEPG